MYEYNLIKNCIFDVFGGKNFLNYLGFCSDKFFAASQILASAKFLELKKKNQLIITEVLMQVLQLL